MLYLHKLIIIKPIYHEKTYTDVDDAHWFELLCANFSE